MPRSPRSHLPGGVFHLVARTLGRRGRFSTSLRRRILVDMAEVFERSDALLVAYAIMPNHLHLVARQGDRPLSSFMQPLLRRIALRVQRAHRTEGHIFERRFRDRVCHEPYYIRNAILYNHLNRVRANLAAAPGDDGEWHVKFTKTTDQSAPADENTISLRRVGSSDTEFEFKHESADNSDQGEWGAEEIPHVKHGAYGSVRWRWSDDDETIWASCPVGCCESRGTL